MAANIPFPKWHLWNEHIWRWATDSRPTFSVEAGSSLEHLSLPRPLENHRLHWKWRESRVFPPGGVQCYWKLSEGYLWKNVIVTHLKYYNLYWHTCTMLKTWSSYHLKAWGLLVCKLDFHRVQLLACRHPVLCAHHLQWLLLCRPGAGWQKDGWLVCLQYQPKGKRALIKYCLMYCTL